MKLAGRLITLPRWVRWSTIGSPALLVLLWIVLSFEAPSFTTFSNQVNILRHASVLILAGLGQSLAVIAGGLNIAVGASAAFGAVVAASVASHAGTVVGYLAGIATGMATGLVLGALVAWFRVNPIVGTIGLLAVARGLAFEVSQGQPVTGVPDSFAWLGGGTVGGVPVPVIVAFFMILLVHAFLTYTTWGRRIYAIGVDQDAARVAGIPVRGYILLAHTLSVTLTAFAGVMLASRVNSGVATIGSNMSLETIAAVVLGGNQLFSGEGSVLRTTLGVIIITMLGNGMDLANVSPYLREILLGIIVIAVVFISVRSSRR